MKTYFCIVNYSEDNKEQYILLQDSENRSVCAWTSLSDALGYWEKGYKKAHARSYEGSMSACINAIFFRPSIVEIEGKPSDKQLKEFGITPDSDSVQIRNISGSAMGVVLDSNLAEKLWNSGTRPKLIST